MRMTEEQYAVLMAKRGARPMAAALMPVEKRPKYGNRKTTDAAGRVHDSSHECDYYLGLELRQRAGEISGLMRHVPFACVVNGIHICDYEADAVYTEGAARVVVDAKPKDPKFRKTQAYRMFRLKQKLMQALHNVQIREV